MSWCNSFGICKNSCQVEVIIISQGEFIFESCAVVIHTWSQGGISKIRNKLPVCIFYHVKFKIRFSFYWRIKYE
jgi:MinD superfamily P-loop ATPase